MPRVAPRSRLDDLAAAATRAFGRTGYRRTRTDQVAADAGMAAGSLFNYVDSKEALFHLVFAHGFGELDADAVDLPMHAPPLDDTVALIDQGLARVVAWPNLAAALRVDDPADVRAELAAIVSDIYRTISEAWPMLAVLERCASDLPAVEAMYFGRGRRGRRTQL